VLGDRVDGEGDGVEEGKKEEEEKGSQWYFGECVSVLAVLSIVS
jgi:hypothetical protein